jgi:hypothetical protein
VIQHRLAVAEAYIGGMANGYQDHYLSHDILVLQWMADAALIGCPELSLTSPVEEAGTLQSALQEMGPPIESRRTDPLGQPVPSSPRLSPQVISSHALLQQVQALIQSRKALRMLDHNATSQQPMDVDTEVPKNEPPPPAPEAGPSGRQNGAGRDFGLCSDKDF